MTSTGNGGRWLGILRYAFGGALCLLAILNLAMGTAWYVNVGVLVVGLLIMLGRRRIFRAGVERTDSGLVCRYVPWYEGNVYLLNVGLPILAVTMIMAGFAPGNPVWLRFGGVVLLLFIPLFLDSAVRMRRKSALRISPSVLTVPTPAPKFQPVEVPRERVVAITPKWVSSVSGAKALHIEIDYGAADLGGYPGSVLLGPQLTVEPQNLFDALTVWKDHPGDDPADLMDRIERILVGRS